MSSTHLPLPQVEILSWLDADSDKDADSLADALLLVGLLTVLPRSLVNRASGEQAV